MERLELTLFLLLSVWMHQSGDEDGRYAFLTEWYDSDASLVRKYLLFFYCKDGSIEMYDVKNRRTFLKRMKCDTVNEADLFIGSTINVFSRQLKFVDYGDQYTKNRLSSKTEKTFALIKPDAVPHMGQIIDAIYQEGFKISKAKMVHVEPDMVKTFYAEHRDKPFFNTLMKYITSGSVVAMELVGTNAVRKWRELLGPTDSQQAKLENPDSIRAQFGMDKTSNACHGSDSSMSADRELQLFFPQSNHDTHMAPKSTATFQDCTCCIIKPHAVQEGLTGQIITAIQEEGFTVSGLQLFYMEHINAQEFYEVYKGVVSEYSSMVNQLASGPCFALEITSKHGDQNVSTFRNFVGPGDPEIARTLRPNTLRAKFGRNKVQNAIHCTDLPEDGLLEVEYFFKLLQ